MDSVCRSRSITKDTNDMMSNVGDPKNNEDEMTEEGELEEEWGGVDAEYEAENGDSKNNKDKTMEQGELAEERQGEDTEYEENKEPRNPEGASALSSNAADADTTAGQERVQISLPHASLSANHLPLNEPNSIALYDTNRFAGNVDFLVPGSHGASSALFMDVNLNPFRSLAGSTGNEAPWDSFLNALDTSDIDFNSWDGTHSSSHNALFQIPRPALDHQSFLPGNGQLTLPSQTVNVETRLPYERLGRFGLSAGDPINQLITTLSQPLYPANFTPLSAQSATKSPEPATSCPIELSDPNSRVSISSSEVTAIPVTSKSGRSIIPSTRHEKMNAIGSNKENVSVTAPSKSNSDWMEPAKTYMLGLDLGQDWKACVDGWAMVERSLEHGRGSKVR